MDARRGTGAGDPRLPRERPLRRASRPGSGRPRTVFTQDAYGRGPVRRALITPCAGGCARATRADRWSTARAGCSPRSSRPSVVRRRPARLRGAGLDRRRRAQPRRGPVDTGPCVALSSAIRRSRSLQLFSCARLASRSPGDLRVRGSRSSGAAAGQPARPEEVGHEPVPAAVPEGVPLPRPRHPPAVRDVRASTAAATRCCARATRSTTSARGPAELHGRAHRPALHARAPADPPARQQAADHGEAGRPAPVQAGPPRAALVEVVQRRALRAVARGRPREADKARARRTEGGLLPARPEAHAPGDRVVAHAPRSTRRATPTRPARRSRSARHRAGPTSTRRPIPSSTST